MTNKLMNQIIVSGLAVNSFELSGWGNYNIKTLAEHELASGRCIYSKYSASQKRCSAGTLTRVNVPETIDWLFNVFSGTLNSQSEVVCHMTTNWTVTLPPPQGESHPACLDTWSGTPES
ncbi:hypothetical protein BB558_006183 [Smittium angustum]|uniref:Uncharacterized protein n=1 Tax=Smittium angustum TaxID=133377 RepID=A0A2U1IYE8_SMIAN|nr:hypothetical protein BB558_006183 [Smittium angustum]